MAPTATVRNRRRRLAIATAAATATVLAGAGVAAATLSAGTAAAAGSPVGTVTVDGTGQVTGTPDVLTVTEDVTETAANVTQALQAANDDVQRVTAALARDGVAAADIQTSTVNISSDDGSNGVPDGYQVDEGVTVKLRDLSTAGRAISDSVAAGGNATRLGGVGFDVNDETTLLNQARDAAFADAKAKAQRYAQLAGRSLGVVRTISETLTGGPVFYGSAAGASAAEVPTAVPSPVPVNPGQQQVSVNVTVSWALQ